MKTELTTEIEELPWPAGGDILFQPRAGCWPETAYVDSSRSRETYCSGFAATAKIAVNYLLRQQGSDALPDLLFCPIAYNYRQAIELRLKDINSIGNKLFNETALTWGHKIADLWKDTRRILEQFYPSDPAVALDSIESMLREIVDVDPNSDGFRYHVDRNNQSTLVKLTTVDIRNFADRMEAVLNFLYGASSELHNYYSDSGCDPW